VLNPSRSVHEFQQVMSSRQAIWYFLRTCFQVQPGNDGIRPGISSKIQFDQDMPGALSFITGPDELCWSAGSQTVRHVPGGWQLTL